MVRCHIDPHIPPKARNAFMFGDKADQLNAETWLSPMGVLLRILAGAGAGRTFLIPLVNIENIEFHPPEDATKKTHKQAETTISLA